MQTMLGVHDGDVPLFIVCFGLVTAKEIHASILTANQISRGPDPETPGNSSVLHRPQ